MSALAAGQLVFADPWWLLLLLAPAAFALWRGKRGGAPAVRFSSTAALRAIGRQRRSLRGPALVAMPHFALACLALALARPQRAETLSLTRASGIDILLVLDVSKSMLAEDFTIGGMRANRLEAIKRVTEDFIKARPADRIGIVAFAGRPYLVSPLTLDHDWLLRNLDRLRIGLVEDGTAIGSAIASASNRMKSRDAKSRLVVLLTDGDNNAGRISPQTAAEAAAELRVKIYTIGAGSRGTARIPVATDPFGRAIYQNIQVNFDEASLRKIAETTGGQYFRATDTASLSKIYAEIDRLEKTDIEIRERRRVTELYAWPASAACLLLALWLLFRHVVWRPLP